jgi:tetratricopeptide (TPR) repeat protein
MDVAPTILNFLQVPPPPTFEGVSLLNPTVHAVYSETLHTHDSFGWSPLRSVRVGGSKYVEAPKPELYDLKKDPAEHTNLVLSDPTKARELRVELGKILTRTSAHKQTPASTSPETEKLLASLGYLGHGPQGSTGHHAADPKDRLPEFRLYERAIDQVLDRHLESAVILLKQVLAQDTTNTLARRDLATCYLDLHDYAKARANFAQVVAVAPGDYPSQFGLGLAAKRLGLIDEARIHLQAACRLAPKAEQCQHELETL